MRYESADEFLGAYESKLIRFLGYPFSQPDTMMTPILLDVLRNDQFDYHYVQKQVQDYLNEFSNFISFKNTSLPIDNELYGREYRVINEYADHISQTAHQVEIYVRAKLSNYPQLRDELILRIQQFKVRVQSNVIATNLPRLYNKITIYALQDPRNKEVRYVGQSHDPNQRHNLHMRYSGSDTTLHGHWLRRLHTVGLEPSLILLEDIYTHKTSDAYYLECWWISYYRFQQHDLLNMNGPGKRHDPPIERIWALHEEEVTEGELVGRRPEVLAWNQHSPAYREEEPKLTRKEWKRKALTRFLNECIIQKPDVEVPKDVLYRVYSDWWRETPGSQIGHTDRYSINIFNQLILELLEMTDAKIHNHSKWIGMTLPDDCWPDPSSYRQKYPNLPPYRFR